MWTRLKSIFSGKTKNDSQTLSSDFNLQVEQAIFLFANHDSLNTDDEVMEFLIAHGIGASEAMEIVIFLPIAFVRQLLTTVEWHDTYLECIHDKKTIERRFSDTKSYQIIWQVTTKYFLGSPQKDTVYKIGGRSAEFRAFNKLLLDNPNGKLEDIQLTQTVIIR